MKKHKIPTIYEQLKDNEERIYFIHYSCQNLSDDNEGYSPRITSIAVLHMKSDQMSSFSMHLIAEELDISREKISEKYDDIEQIMLQRFLSLLKHGTMILYGFIGI